MEDLESVDNVVSDVNKAKVEVIEAGIVYVDLKTGKQVMAIKQSPNEDFWFVELLKDEKVLMLPAWGLVKNPEAYSEEAQKLAKKKNAKRRAEERARKIDEIF